MHLNRNLNEEERALCYTAPEECLRRLIGRGGLALDEVTLSLPPHVAAAVRVIASGERLTPAGEPIHLAGSDRGDTLEQTLRQPLPAGAPPAAVPDWARAFADEFPEYVFIFEHRPAVPDQALKAPPPVGEGPAAPDRELKAPLPVGEGPAAPDRELKAPPPVGEGPAAPAWVRAFAATYPGIAGLLQQGRITPREAVETIQAVDQFLGNYVTGTRYAAP